MFIVTTFGDRNTKRHTIDNIRSDDHIKERFVAEVKEEIKISRRAINVFTIEIVLICNAVIC